MSTVIMAGKVQPWAPPAIVPISKGAEPFRILIEARRQRLQEHNPNAVVLGANALRAMYDVANGKTPELRCDVDERLRRYQFSGKKGLRVEDLAAIGLESERGREVVIAGLCVLAEALGFRLAPIQTGSVSDRRRAAIGLTAAFGAATATIADAIVDGDIDEAEEAEIARQLDEVQARMELLRARKASRAPIEVSR